MDTLIKNDLPVPDFQLTDLDGKNYRLGDQGKKKVVVINFWSAECPWVERIDPLLLDYLSGWGTKVQLCSIASNVNENITMIRDVAEVRNLPLVLHDVDARTADLYGAKTTPHLFVVDRRGILRYQGAFDDVTFRQRTPSVLYLRDAVEAVLSDLKPDVEITDPYGCTIVRHLG